jgi:hypothetical protein
MDSVPLVGAVVSKVNVCGGTPGPELPPSYENDSELLVTGILTGMPLLPLSEAVQSKPSGPESARASDGTTPDARAAIIATNRLLEEGINITE